MAFRRQTVRSRSAPPKKQKGQTMSNGLTFFLFFFPISSPGPFQQGYISRSSVQTLKEICLKQTGEAFDPPSERPVPGMA
jgi:hypothetical protein